jgi:hypothetical protein
LAQLGRHDEAVAGRLKALGIPARDPGTPPALVDLSAHYNLSFQDQTHPWEPTRSVESLASLEPGDRFLAGVRFDVRGAIRAGNSPNPAEGRFLTPHVRDLAIHQHCRRLHFLHVIYYAGQQGVAAGRYVVHYEDGSQVEIPLVHDQNIGYWSGSTALVGGELVRAWIRAGEPTPHLDRWGRLYRFGWSNPKPHLRIETVDLEPAKATTGAGLQAMLLVAITAQAEPTPTITRHPQRLIVKAGEPASFNVEAQDEAPVAYQWQLNDEKLPAATNATLHLPAAERLHVGQYTVHVRSRVAEPVIAVTSQPAGLAVQEGDLIVGALRRQMFTNLPGSKLTDLTNALHFPLRPNSVDWVPQFEVPPDAADHYGVRLTGFLLPPESDEYRFYLSSDDEGALFLSTDDSQANARLIAREPLWTASRDWTVRHGRPNQENVSRAIRLDGGRRYSVEALMKEGEGADSLAVTWRLSDEPEPGIGSPPIPGRYLAVPAEWIKTQP